MHVRCPHCQSPIEIVADNPLTDMVCSSCGSNFHLVSGQSTATFTQKTKRIAHFELLEQVGAGKFGSVWKARDTELDRTVAIKIPRSGQLDELETEQFLREARAAAQVRHSHIVSVHEIGRDNDNVYIVSDFVQGANLADWLGGQRPSFREAAELCVTIADALHVAHDAGVVHRDLKPGNIMMDLDGRPYVTDFGLAKREAGEITMTIEGRILGTPAYMPPEQASGKAHEADRRADVYSLGVILYELITGELPFRGQRQMLIVQILREEPTPPRKLNHRIPRDLETICLKCLEKAPARRYQSAAEFGEELGRYLNGEAIHARPVGRPERAIRWCRRNPVIAAMTTAIVVLFLLGFAGVTWQWLQAETARRETADALEKESRAKEEAETARRETADALKKESRAREEADEARDDAKREESRAYHALLENYHATAESKLAQSRHMHTKEDSPGARDDALAMLSEAGSVSEKATSVLQKLGPLGQDIQDKEHRAWFDRLIQLRYEAARWLSQPRLDHVQTVRLRVESSPHVAISRDEELIAVTQASGQILLLGKDGVVQDRIDVPRPSPNAEPSSSVTASRVALSPAADRMAVIFLVYHNVPDVYDVSEVLVLSMQGEVVNTLKLPEPIQYEFGAWNHAQLAFPETNVVNFDGYTLDVDTGEVRGEPVGRYAVPAACTEFEATFGANRSINVQRLADGAAVNVQIPEPESKSSMRPIISPNEGRWLMQFGNDNRSLFVSQQSMLALIDAPTGTKSVRTVVPLSSNSERSTVERLMPPAPKIEQLVPLDEGVAVLVKAVDDDEVDDDQKASWELSFWRTTLPAGHLASLPHPQSPNALVSKDGMVVSGGYDRMVRAFRDGTLLWSAGASSPFARPSFRRWDFMAGGEQYLQVERVAIPPNIACFYATELYTPDGQLVRSFVRESQLGDGRDPTEPAETRKGTVVATNSDHTLAVVMDDTTDDKHSLQLWSLPENKQVGDLGDHSSGKTIAEFSPDDQWLVTCPGGATEAHVWQLPGPTLVGNFAVARSDTSDFDIEFIRGRPWLWVLEDEEMGSRVLAQLVDLQSATKICDLQDVSGEYRSWSALPATDELLGISGGDFFSNHQYHVTIWDTKTGNFRRWVIPTDWSSTSYLGPLMVLSPDGTRLLLAGLLERDRRANNPPHVELWDLQNETVLYSDTKGRTQGEIGSVPFAHDYRWSETHDDEVVSLTLVAHHGRPTPPTVTRLHLNWSDGKETEKHDELDERSKSIVARGRKDDVWLIRNTDEGLVFESAPGESPVVLAETGGLVFPADKAAVQRPRLPRAKRSDDATDVFPSPDGEKLAISIVTGTPDAQERLSCLWNARTGERIAEFSDGIRLRGFDPTGRWFATSDAEGKVAVWDAHSGKPARTFQVPPLMGEFEVKIHSSGQHAAVLSKEILTLWNVEQGQQLATIERPGHSTAINCVSHHKKAGLVASGGNETVILLWDRESGELRRSLLLEAASVKALQFNPAGDRLAFVAPDRLALIDLEGRQLWTLDIESRGWRFPVFAFHPSGDFLAAGTEDGRVVFVDAKSGELLGAHQADKTSIKALGFSQDGKYMATGSEGKRIHLWDDSGKGPCAAWDTDSPITSVFFADNKTLATAGEDIQLWAVPTKREILRLPVSEPPASLVSSSEGAYELLVPDQNGAMQFDLSELERQFEQLRLGRGEDAPALFTRTDSAVAHNWDKALDLYGEELADE